MVVLYDIVLHIYDGTYEILNWPRVHLWWYPMILYCTSMMVPYDIKLAQGTSMVVLYDVGTL